MIIKDWQSAADHEMELKLMGINHYKIHPEMLPYVGKHYRNVKILLIGESHYLCEGIDNRPDDKYYMTNKWYEESVPENFTGKHYFNTRHIVHNFLVERRSRAHSIFRNPAKGIIEALDLKDVTDSEAFSACAFMNYFQRPALISGETINYDDISVDKEYSYNVLKSCKEILKPYVTIFLSKKAFEAYSEFAGDKTVDIYCVMHPTCSHWNGINGKEKFISIIKELNSTAKIDCSLFEQNQRIKYENITFPKEYTKVRKKRFNNSNIFVQLRGSHDNISEIVIYFTSNGVRYGVGFVVRYGYIWIWDYNNKRYVTEDALNGNQTIKDKYNYFKKWIEELQ